MLAHLRFFKDVLATVYFTPSLRVSVESWLRVVREAPARIRVRQSFLEALDLKLRKAKRAKAKRQRPNPAGNDIMAGPRIEERARSETR
jgi:hypothetical protein